MQTEIMECVQHSTLYKTSFLIRQHAETATWSEYTAQQLKQHSIV